MNIKDILSISESISINDQRLVGQIISRNQIMTTSEIMTVIPFQFTLRPHKYLYYSQNRQLLANLRYYDRSLMQYLNFTGTGWQSYIEYQGDLTSAQIASCQWQTSSTLTNLVLGNIPPEVDAMDYIVKAGDFCQVSQYAYIATQDVLRGSGLTVTIPVHRTLMTSLNTEQNCVIGQYGTTVSMGGNTYTGITFQILLRSYPTYTLVPVADDSFIAWDDDFVAFESVL